MRAAAALFLGLAALHSQTRLAPDQIRDSLPPPSAITLKSITTSSTQAVIAYTAPNAAPCGIVISEGSTIGAPVIDVNPALFAGADSDSRPGSLANGNERAFVAGHRSVGKALDGKYYSRSLQAYADHAYRITCGQAQIEGTFRTGNIPGGVTYADAFQVDPERPGRWMLPTQLQDRRQTIRDPQTGLLLKRMSLDAEKNGSGTGGFILSYGGMVRNCGIERITAPDGTSGYLCTIYDMQAMGALYWVIPATGEVRYLGIIRHGYPYVSGQKTFFWMDDQGNIYKQAYAGDFKEVQAGQNATLTEAVYYSGYQGGLVKAFDPTFDDALFGCSGAGADAGRYAMMTCARRGQDSYGWVAALYGGDGRPIAPNCPDGNACPRIVAAMNVMNAKPTRWCGLHNQQLVPGYPLISINYQRLVDWGYGIGTAPWVMHPVANVSATDTVFVVDGQPRPNNTDPYRQDLGVGDLIAVAGNAHEVLEVKAIAVQSDGKLQLTVQRDRWQQGGSQSIPAGEYLWMMCTGWNAMGYWKFAEDPHGTDQSGSKVINDYYWGYGGHMDNGPLGRVEEAGGGWQAVTGDIMANLGKPVSLTVNDSVTFSTANALAYGATTSKHPSYHQNAPQTTSAQQQWFLDFTPFDGSNVISDPNATYLISGQLYKYAVAPGYGGDIKRRSLPTSASTGGESLRDISGPNSQIGDTGADAYTYCIAERAGECRSDSQAGAVYVNAPNVQYRYCSGGDGPNPQNKDLCLGNLDIFYQGVDQVFLSQVSNEDGAAKTRVLTHGMSGLKNGLYYSLAKSLPDASWMIFTSIDPDTGNSNGWIGKLPPLDTVGDGVNRTQFIPKSVQIPKPADARVTGAAIEFGYAEDAPADQYHCTTRNEVCLATAGSIDPAHAFSWEYEKPAPMPCADGCGITIPLAPMRAAYWRVRYYDAGGSVIATGPPGVVIDGAQVTPPGRRRTL